MGTTDSGHILHTGSCLDVQCAILAEVDIACFWGARAHHLYVSLAFPTQYGKGFGQITDEAANIALISPGNEKPLGHIKTRIMPPLRNDAPTFVELTDVEAPFKEVMSLPFSAKDALRVEGVWPIAVDIPLDGFVDGFADLLSRCGKDWQLP